LLLKMKNHIQSQPKILKAWNNQSSFINGKGKNLLIKLKKYKTKSKVQIQNYICIDKNN
jgi:hypothetical protein